MTTKKAEIVPAKDQAVATVSDATSNTIALLEKVALNPDVPVDKMERILDMQERIMDRQASMEFANSMSEAQAEMPAIVKDTMNTQTGSTYAKLEKINKAITPIYTKYGFSLSFGTDKADGEDEVRVVCDVIHRSGSSRRYIYDSPIDDKGIKGSVNKTRAHAKGSAITYGRRYLTCLIFNLNVGEDDDGNAATEAVNEQTITGDQAVALRKLLKEKEVPEKELLDFAGLASIETMPKHWLQNAMKWVRSYHNA